VSLTAGRGPLSDDPAGTFDRPMPHGVTYTEPFHRRVRGLDGDRVLVDSDRAVLVHRPGRPPMYAFPAEHVHGVASVPEPNAEGYVAVDWSSVPAWYEEDERVLGHPRNPYHRVDCVRSRRRLRVEVGGEVLADTRDVVLLDETGLTPRLYVAREQVRMDLLVASSTRTYCPYKGEARYWSARVGDVEVADVAWSYDDPLPESTPIAGMLSFYAHRVALITDPGGGRDA
jgi:uncharacterized protein (DUF427 family)